MIMVSQYEDHILKLLDAHQNTYEGIYDPVSVRDIIKKSTLRLTTSRGAITYPEVTNAGVIEHTFTVYDLLESLCDKQLVAEVADDEELDVSNLKYNKATLDSTFKKLRRYLVSFRVRDIICESYIPYNKGIGDVKDGFWINSDYEISNVASKDVMWLPPSAIQHIIIK